MQENGGDWGEMEENGGEWGGMVGNGEKWAECSYPLLLVFKTHHPQPRSG